MEKFVIIDGNNLMFRAFYALPQLSNFDGEISNAVFGFTNMLVKVIKEENPKYIAVAFDVAKKNFRHEKFAQYKGTRKPTPSELISQFPIAKELLKKMKIKHVVLDGDQKAKTIWRKFQSDKKIRVIVCQYQTACAGIDLFASDTIIYFEPTLRSNTLEQSRDRIHRTGQTNKCSYIHLITKGTVEVDIYRALSGYSDFSEKLFVEYMDGYRRSYN